MFSYSIDAISLKRKGGLKSLQKSVYKEHIWLPVTNLLISEIYLPSILGERGEKLEISSICGTESGKLGYRKTTILAIVSSSFLHIETVERNLSFQKTNLWSTEEAKFFWFAESLKLKSRKGEVIQRIVSKPEKQFSSLSRQEIMKRVREGMNNTGFDSHVLETLDKSQQSLQQEIYKHYLE